jgi:hypothetical protein
LPLKPIPDAAESCGEGSEDESSWGEVFVCHTQVCSFDNPEAMKRKLRGKEMGSVEAS